ncbi:MAG: 2-hydroxyacid dehydrogenase [Chloroflexia bacterium]|nr:2-hydroxyacid dehydrogenase [Chloroflexia bacterium]
MAAGVDHPDRPLPTLVAGDRFVLNRLLLDALTNEIGDRLDPRTVELAWPVEPFGPVAEVQEAVGTEEQMLDLLAGVEVAVTEMAPFTERVLAGASALRLIVVCRGGPVNVNLTAATARQIPVCYTPGRNAAATAEYAIGLLLAAMRQIAAGANDLREGIWRGDFYAYDVAGEEIDGKTVGLVGFGAVGARVAKILRAFGAEVLVADPYVEPTAVAAVGARSVPLTEMLPRAQAISLHARLTPETRQIIGPEEIAQLPRGAVLINTARGGLLDHDALCDALDSGQLRAAALDVYDPEPPPPGSRLFQAPNLVMSPHIAGASRETAERAAKIAAAEVGRYLRGESLRYVANPAAIGQGGGWRGNE